MELTDGQLLIIASIIKYNLGDAYYLYGSSYCYKFEREVMTCMKSGMEFTGACKDVCRRSGLKW